MIYCRILNHIERIYILQIYKYKVLYYVGNFMLYNMGEYTKQKGPN